MTFEPCLIGWRNMASFNLFDGNERPIRQVHFAGNAVDIVSCGAPESNLVEFLFADVSARPDPTVDSHARFCLQRDGSAIYRLFCNGAMTRRTFDEALMAESMLGDVGYQLTTKSSGGMVFHAAAVAWQGKGVLLPGASGSGKSTLTAWLASHGYAYLTDELVFVPSRMTHMEAFSRPLNLKRSSRAVLAGRVPFDAEKGRILSSKRADIVPSALLTTRPPTQKAPLSAIVFPRYIEDARHECKRLVAARSGLLLMQHLINARNLQSDGFNEIVRVARTTPAYCLQYANLADAEVSLHRIFDALNGDAHACANKKRGKS